LSFWAAREKDANSPWGILVRMKLPRQQTVDVNQIANQSQVVNGLKWHGISGELMEILWVSTSRQRNILSEQLLGVVFRNLNSQESETLLWARIPQLMSLYI